MSKASEWAVRYQAAYGRWSDAPHFEVVKPTDSPNSYFSQAVYRVAPDGGLNMEGYDITATRAVEFARWILSIFEEPN